MPTTALNALPYPTLANNSNVPLDLQNLANAIDPKLGIVSYRKVAITASGALTSTSQVNLVANQTLPAQPFGAGVNYVLTVKCNIRMDIPATAGATLDVMVGGTAYVADHFGHTGSTTASVTLHADELIPITSNTAQTVNVRLTSIGGTLTVINTGRFVTIEAKPSKAL